MSVSWRSAFITLGIRGGLVTTGLGSSFTLTSGNSNSVGTGMTEANGSFLIFDLAVSDFRMLSSFLLHKFFRQCPVVFRSGTRWGVARDGLSHRRAFGEFHVFANCRFQSL